LTSAKLETTAHLDNRPGAASSNMHLGHFFAAQHPSAAVLIRQIDAFKAGGTRG